ncbi:hypothetical protein, partial [Effusibacillus consociatus]|uniref:hypothetical protein n=1 Tax=Effusibacillus consociatus TaxID=1117041 RepID=UPI0036D438E5
MRLLKFFLKCFLVLALITGILPVLPASQVSADPGTYTRVVPYQSTPGTPIAIEWDFELDHVTNIEIHKADGTLLKTIVENQFFSKGDNVHYFDGTIDGKPLEAGMYYARIAPQDEYRMYATKATFEITEEEKQPSPPIFISPTDGSLIQDPGTVTIRIAGDTPTKEIELTMNGQSIPTRSVRELEWEATVTLPPDQ